jgi:O-methyltransferase
MRVPLTPGYRLDSLAATAAPHSKDDSAKPDANGPVAAQGGTRENSRSRMSEFAETLETLVRLWSRRQFRSPVSVLDSRMSSISKASDLFPEIDALPFRKREHFADIRDELFWHAYERFRPFTLVGIERFYDVYTHTRHIAQAGIPGDFVECGVFLGGLMAAAAEFAANFGIADRTFYLFDSFAGFPSGAGDTDVTGKPISFGSHPNFKRRVEQTLALSKCGSNRFELVEGFVEETLKRPPVDEIALLRLDTDYYESTIVELEALYPRLSVGGVLIIDDYGHFGGVRRAADEFLARQADRCALHRVDYTGRSGIKAAARLSF